MSYCRFGEADAYIYEHVGGWIECCACSLASVDGLKSFKAETHEDMFRHVLHHRAAGDYIPQDVDDRLIRDMSENVRSGYVKSNYYLVYVEFDRHPSRPPEHSMSEFESLDSLKEYFESLSNFRAVTVRYIG
jgi:hypothetical protein